MSSADNFASEFGFDTLSYREWDFGFVQSSSKPADGVFM
jgi:hypothetical protein